MKMEKKAVIEVNANFHLLYGKEDCRPKGEKYNQYRKKWKENPENFTVGDFPLHLDIESTNACNLKCPFCTFSIADKETPGKMDWEIYRRIIDEGREYDLPSIKLSVRGEPLLHPRVVEMVEYAKRNGIIDVYFNTNGVLLTKEVSEKLIEAGLDRISISFEGTTKEVYETNRVGARYEDVLKNIETLIHCKDKNRASSPRIRIQSVLISGMEEKLDDYVNFWKEKGVDEVACLDLEKEPGGDEDLTYPWVCPQLWQRMSIWHDGTILPCCHDTYGSMKIGNVKDLRIADVWGNELEIAYRNLHKNGYAELLHSCRICPLRAGQIRKLKHKGNR